MKITFTATYVVVGGVILRSIQRRSRPVSAQTDEVKGLKWECIARWFVSVVLVTLPLRYVSMFRSLVWCGERGGWRKVIGGSGAVMSER